jgi:hypothetical protein
MINYLNFSEFARKHLYLAHNTLNMKKLLLGVVCAGLSAASLAQDENTEKKVQLGMAYQFGLNFNKPGTKVISRDGAGVQNTIGMNMNYSFNQNIGVFTGIEFDFESFKYNVTSTDPIYYRFNDTEIFQKEDGTGGTVFNLTHRKQRPIYGTIPVMMLFRTNMIGSFRYYGKFGPRLSFLLSQTADDEGFLAPNSSASNDNMKPKGDINFFRGSIGLAAGTEWNFTGNTAVFAELGFYYGFTEIHRGEALTGQDKERNMSLYQNTSGGSTIADDYLTFSAKQKQIVLKVGILF